MKERKKLPALLLSMGRVKSLLAANFIYFVMSRKLPPLVTDCKMRTYPITGYNRTFLGGSNLKITTFFLGVQNPLALWEYSLVFKVRENCWDKPDMALTKVFCQEGMQMSPKEYLLGRSCLSW